jgi:hypothetical protein
MKVRVSFTDGTYAFIKWEGKGPFVEISDEMWALYHAHLEQDNVWHKIMRDIDNRIFEMEERVK